MNEKFMKIIKIAIPTLTVILIASQLFRIAVINQDETLKLIQKNEMIEIEIAVPADEEQGELKSLEWIILSELDTYQDTLRTPLEKAFNIKVDPTTGEKTGSFYKDAKGNTVKDNSLKLILTSNQLVAQMLDNETTLQALSDAACNTYADLEEDDVVTNAMLALNGYFNLLPDGEPAYANPNSTLTRAEFMTMVFRADNTVDTTLTVNKDFESLVGKSEYNLFAQGLADKTYLNITDKSLNEKTYVGTISRAEAVYYFMNTYFADELKDFDASKVKLDDTKDGGNIAAAQGFADKKYSKSYELIWAINNPEEGLPTDLYKALAFAQYKRFIDSETRWDEGLTKAESLELLVNIYKNLGTPSIDAPTPPESEVPETETPDVETPQPDTEVEKPETETPPPTTEESTPSDDDNTSGWDGTFKVDEDACIDFDDLEHGGKIDMEDPGYDLGLDFN